MVNLKKIIRFLANLVYVIFIGYIIIWGVEYLNHLRKMVGQTYVMPYHYLPLNTFFPVFIGMLMALPQFINTAKKPGPWQLDWVILLSVGLPAFFVAILPWAYFTPIGKHLIFTSTLTVNPVLHTVSGLVSGYLLLSLPEKAERK